MVDKKLLEAARKKYKKPATAEAPAAPVNEKLLEKARAKFGTKKASPTTAAAPPPAAPLVRLKGDARPVEPVAKELAVAPSPAVPAPRTSPPAAAVKPPEATDASTWMDTARSAVETVGGAAMSMTPFGLGKKVYDVGKTVYDVGTTPFVKSGANALRDLEGAKALVGAQDPKAFVKAQKQADAIKYNVDLQKRVGEYNEAPGFAARIQYLYNNPDVLTAITEEQSANAAITTGGAMAGAAAGSVVPLAGTAAGAVVGTAATSIAANAASAVSQYMQDKGIDPTNEDQVRGLFMNPEAMKDMRSYAAKYGVAVGSLDALGTLLGIKGAGAIVAKPIMKLMGQEAVGPVAELAANTAINAVTSGAGEAAGGLWSKGKINANDVYDEVIFGTAADLGSASVETMIARHERGGAAPTAEEILAAGGISAQPPETIVTPDEATAEGRTLFGFAPHDSTDPVTVGTYNEAETEAGKGDLRRGKIIAVKEDQASAPVSVDEVVKAVDSPQAGALAPIRDRLHKLGAVGVDLYARIQGAVNKYDSDIATGGDPTLTKQVFTDTVTKMLQNSKRFFSGDRKNLGVSPAVRNEIPMDAFEHAYGGLRRVNSLRQAEKNILDGDALEAGLKGKNWKLVPAGIKRIIAGDPRMEKVFDKTFTFTSPEARQQFIDGNLKDRTALMKSGDVAWAGKLDGRFFTGSNSVASNERDITVLDETNNEVQPPAALSFLNSFLKPGRNTQGLDVRTQFPRRRGYAPDAAELAEFQNFIGLTPGSFKTFSTNGFFTKFDKLFQKWHKMFRVQLPTAFIELHIDANGKYVWPAELVKNMPLLVAKLDPQKYGFYGMCWDLTEFGRVVILRTEQPGSFNARSESDHYHTLAHEMGHVISSEHFAAAPLETRNKIFGAYRRFILANPTTPEVLDQLKRRRFAGSQQSEGHTATGLEQQRDYYMSFEEWFAEQTARWGETNGRPLGVLGKFFREIAKKIVAVYKDLRKQFPDKLEFRAEFEMDQFLSSVWDGNDVLTNWPENAVNYTETLGRQKNAKVDPDPLSQHASTANVSAAMNAALQQPFLSASQKSLLTAVKAGVDRYNWFYEWALNLRQLAARNPHIQELQLINELFDFAKKDATNIMIEAEGYLKRWRQRSRTQQDALGGLLFEMDRMSYLKPNEKPRWPTPTEFADMVKRLGLDGDTVNLYKDIRDFFLNSIRRQEELQMQEARRITDPTLQAAAIKSAQEMSRHMLQRPYFPHMRFGKWSLTVKDAKGKLEHFETFETKKELQAALDEAVNDWPSSVGWQVEGSTIPQEVQPFVGVPPWMLDQLRSMPGLSQTQQDWLEAFKYQLAPSNSFRKRMMRRKNYSGFSLEAKRVFANYGFHHARFYSRIKHDWNLRQSIDGLRHSRNPGSGPTDISDRKRMADFVERIYKEFRNPTQDWTALRVLNAIWHLGAVPASAIVNLSQTALATAPFLSAKFGNIKGEAALMKAASNLTSYYKKGSYASMPGDEFKAIARAVQDGYIDESMAAELAAAAVGSGAGLRAGRSLFTDKLSQGWQFFSDKSMWMFRMAEQWNRRVSFRAARQLAFDNPNVQWVQDLQIKHFLKYDELVRGGWTHREAVSYLAGVETLLETHYSYDRLARPRFMQGKKSVLFAFYMFTQNSLFMLWNNKDMMARYMLYMAIVAGPMGLVPDDAEEVLNAIASKLFGKDFNLEREARKLIVSLLGDDSTVPPDLLLHGISRYSFGLAKAGDTIGAKFVPDIDMSNSMAINRVLPLNISSMLKPAGDWNERISNMTRDAAGAAYGIPLAIGKAIAGSDLNIEDFKRWEGAMPRAFKSVSRMLRMGYEGGDRNAQGSQTLTYDYEDPKELGELLAVGAGFTPTKQSQYWDEQMAAKEMDLFWSGQKQMLLQELFQSKYIYQDNAAFQEGIEKVKTYNARAPAGYVITQKSIIQSLKTRAKRKAQIESGQNPYVGQGVEDEAKRLFPEGSILEERNVK